MNNCRVMGGEESLRASLKERLKEEEKKLSRKMFFVNLFLLYFTDVREDEGFVRGEIVYKIYFIAIVTNKSK